MRIARSFFGPALLGIAAGASLVVQSALNAQLRTVLNSPVRAGFISYVGGTLTMLLVVIAMREPWTYVADFSRSPWWVWTGGFFGAVYIVVIIVLLPRLGAATVFALLVAGQMLASLLFDHFSVLGMAQRLIDPTRILGALLLVVAVVLIRRP